MLAEVEGCFPGTRVTKLDGKPVDIKVADLIDDLEAVYKIDTSAKGRAEREQWRKNQLFVDVMLKQKHLKD